MISCDLAVCSTLLGDSFWLPLVMVFGRCDSCTMLPFVLDVRRVTSYPDLCMTLPHFSGGPLGLVDWWIGRARRKFEAPDAFFLRRPG